MQAGVTLYNCEDCLLRSQEIYHIQLRLVYFELYHLYLEMEQLLHRFHDIFFQLQKLIVNHEGSY